MTRLGTARMKRQGVFFAAIILVVFVLGCSEKRENEADKKDLPSEAQVSRRIQKEDRKRPQASPRNSYELDQVIVLDSRREPEEPGIVVHAYFEGGEVRTRDVQRMVAIFKTYFGREHEPQDKDELVLEAHYEEAEPPSVRYIYEDGKFVGVEP